MPWCSRLACGNCVSFFMVVLIVLAVFAANAAAAGETYESWFEMSMNGTRVFHIDVQLCNASAGFVLYYWLYTYARYGNYSTGNATMHWYVAGPDVLVYQLSNTTIVKFVWSVYETPRNWSRPVLRGVNTTYIYALVRGVNDTSTIQVGNVSLVHSYDVIMYVDMIGNRLGAIVNVTNLTIAGSPTTWFYTFLVGATLNMNYTSLVEPSFLIRYSINNFAYVYRHPGWVINTRVSVGASASSTAIVYEAHSIPRRPSVELACDIVRGNRTTVYLIVRDWGAIETLTVTSPYFVVTVNGTTLSFATDRTPELFYINSTTLVYGFRIVVQPGVYVITASYTMRTIYGTVYSGEARCSLIRKILLAIPDTITTYSPNVTITGYVYDYYTGRPLPGITLDVYLGDEKIASVVSGPDGSFTVYVVLGEPGTYTLRYLWNGVEAGKTTIVYMSGGELREFAETVTKNIEVAFRRIPVSVPGIAIPRPSLDTPQAILLAGGVAALWAWMANTVSLSYATVVTGFILAVLGIVYGNAAMIAAGAAAMVAGYMIRRSLEQ